MSKMDTKDFLIGAVIGSIVGASAAMLFAPKSGRELRTDINEKAHQAKDKTVELTHAAKEKGSEYSQLAKEKSDEWSQVAKEQWSKVADRTVGISNKATQMGEDLASDVKDLMENEKAEGKKLAKQVVQEIEETKEKLKDDVEEFKNK
ncbi:YtxH domain-containing protein [Bacillus sp. A301a_S52]|jgi:gas vesicle protein|nr:YtxH domain-containing protein [Bacillus sp. A301a_S52]